MLRSFQYQETSYANLTLLNDAFREKEVEIAKRYVYAHPRLTDCGAKCPVCGEDKGKHFYTKWEVRYNRCDNCKSVYAVCDEETVQGYFSNPELIELRRSAEYQAKVTQDRAESWNEFIEWVQVRAYRFMKRNKNLSVIDIGNRFAGYSKAIAESELTGEYELQESILKKNDQKVADGGADIVFFLDQMQKGINVTSELQKIRTKLKDDGLLILNTRAGSGFDIITLKEDNERIYPYEHILLPSFKGLITLLESNGYEVLEITTPGVLDVKYVMQSLDKLEGREEFVKYLLEESDMVMLQEFQRFLQKGGLSSFVCVIAGKRQEE